LNRPEPRDGDRKGEAGAVSTGPASASGTDRAIDAELWAETRRDPESGLAAIYDRYSGLVYGVSLKILRDPHEAEDLTQEVFIHLVRRPGYDPERGSLSAYLSTLTRSRAIDRLRGRTRQSRMLEQVATGEPPPEVDRNSPHERMSAVERSNRVSSALAKLPEKQRQVLELAYYRGLSQSEIATEIDAPLGTVKSSTRNGLLQLRALLEPSLS
jgi:RNA polymerase sigma-70 factor (ECF subfamily)